MVWYRCHEFSWVLMSFCVFWFQICETAWTAAVHSQGSKDRREIWIHHGLNLIILSDLCFLHGTPSATPSHPRGGLSSEKPSWNIRNICRWGVSGPPIFFGFTLGSRPWAMGQSSSGELQKELLYAEDSDGSSHSVGWVRSESFQFQVMRWWSCHQGVQKKHICIQGWSRRRDE